MAKAKKQFTANQMLAVVSLCLITIAIIIGSQYINQETRLVSDASESRVTSSDLANGNQRLTLSEGMNLVSFFVEPNSLAVEDVFKQLVNNKKLLLVKNNIGQVYWPDYNINQIGNISLEEGYEVHLKSHSNITVTGTRIVLPFDINLKQGWNLISYPTVFEQDAVVVMQSLIDDGSLVAVQDVNGKALREEDGVWINDIGNLRPGNAYQVYMFQDALLTIN